MHSPTCVSFPVVDAPPHLFFLLMPPCMFFFFFLKYASLTPVAYFQSLLEWRRLKARRL